MNLVVLGVLAAFALVYRFANALFILFVGVAIGMAVKPGVEWLRRRGIPRFVGALTIYVALGGGFAGATLLVTPAITEGMSTLVVRGPRQLESLRARMAASESPTLRHLAGAQLSAAGPSKLAPSTVFSYGGAVGRNVAAVLAVLLLGFYWTLEGDRRVRVLALLAPYERRRAIQAFIGEIERTVGAYLRGQSLLCLIVGLMAFGIYRAMGLPHATALGLLYAIGEAVPVVGPIIGTAAAGVVALSIKPSLVLWVAGAAASIQLIENYALVPRLMGRMVGVSPLVTLLAIAAFGSTLGIAGAVLAIPLAAIVQLLLYRFLLGSDARATDPPVGRGAVSVVRYEIHELTRDIRKRLSLHEDEVPAERIEDAIEGIAYDLDRLLAEREARP
jgi:predicted PurR-regulated permease PerM